MPSSTATRLHPAERSAGHGQQQQGIAVVLLGHPDREVTLQVLGCAGAGEVALRPLHGAAHVERLGALAAVGRHVQRAAIVGDPSRLPAPGTRLGTDRFPPRRSCRAGRAAAPEAARRVSRSASRTRSSGACSACFTPCQTRSSSSREAAAGLDEPEDPSPTRANDRAALKAERQARRAGGPVSSPEIPEGQRPQAYADRVANRMHLRSSVTAIIDQRSPARGRRSLPAGTA